MTAADTTMDPADLRAALERYTATGVSEGTWSALRGPAIDLVLAAGDPRWDRARNDLQLIADLTSYLTRRGQSVTLETALADETLPGLDGEQAAAGRQAGTRANKRSRFHRLQAAHRGLPWRKQRRDDGERIAALPQPELLTEIAGLLPSDGVAGRTGAGAVQAALDAARLARAGLSATAASDIDPEPSPCLGLDPKVWRSARAYAKAHGVALTQRMLKAGVIFEALALSEPVAVLATRFRLTRRDLDLGLTQAASLPAVPQPEHAAALRG